MRYRRTDRQSTGVLAFNATPLVDVIFLLTIFFMLVSHFSSAEQVTMELPKPIGSRAEVAKMPDRVTINCRLADPDDEAGRDVLYSVGPNLPEPLSVISDRLGAMKRDVPALKVVVRADRRLRYVDVRRVMRVIAQHHIEMLNVVAHVGEGE
jgi:biopolymer transport protein ExbD